jgi:CRISPR-associated endonuclease/helicase Cas3
MFNGLEVREIFMQEDPDLSGKEIFFPGSPVLIKRKTGEKIDHILYNDPRAGSYLKETLLTKMEQVGLKDDTLEIGFDMMITECAPIDSLIQRFGRINRIRTKDTVGHFKPIYVLKPPTERTDALPYGSEVLQRTFEALPNGKLMKEVDVQKLIDLVYPSIQFIDIDLSAVFTEGKWKIKELWHNSKSALLETLDIDSVTCIEETDREHYDTAPYEEQSKLEIPVSYRSVGYRNLDKSKEGSRPFVIPTKAYNTVLGFLIEYAKPEFYDKTQQFL